MFTESMNETLQKLSAVFPEDGGRTGRPLSPPQIHQKNILTLSKIHKTTSECRQRTSGTQKSSPTLQKELPEKVRRFYTQITEWRGGDKSQHWRPPSTSSPELLDLGRTQNAGPTESAPLRTTRVPEPERLGPGSSAQGRPLIVPGGTT